MTALFSMKSRHGRHCESMTSCQKSVDAYLLEEQLCQISSRNDGALGLGRFEEIAPSPQQEAEHEEQQDVYRYAISS